MTISSIYFDNGSNLQNSYTTSSVTYDYTEADFVRLAQDEYIRRLRGLGPYKPVKPTIKQELQQEVDDWLKDIKL